MAINLNEMGIEFIVNEEDVKVMQIRDVYHIFTITIAFDERRCVEVEVQSNDLPNVGGIYLYFCEFDLALGWINANRNRSIVTYDLEEWAEEDVAEVIYNSTIDLYDPDCTLVQREAGDDFRWKLRDSAIGFEFTFDLTEREDKLLIMPYASDSKVNFICKKFNCYKSIDGQPREYCMWLNEDKAYYQRRINEEKHKIIECENQITILNELYDFAK